MVSELKIYSSGLAFTGQVFRMEHAGGAYFNSVGGYGFQNNGGDQALTISAYTPVVTFPVGLTSSALIKATTITV